MERSSIPSSDKGTSNSLQMYYRSTVWPWPESKCSGIDIRLIGLHEVYTVVGLYPTVHNGEMPGNGHLQTYLYRT
jgi:hypothetical protein